MTTIGYMSIVALLIFSIFTDDEMRRQSILLYTIVVALTAKKS